MALTSKQRAQLRGLASTADTVVTIGKSGVTEEVLDSAQKVLKARELIKCKVLETCDLTPQEACDALCEGCKAEPVQVIGTKFVIFKRNPNDPKIELVKASKK